MSVFTSALDEQRWFCRARWHYYMHRPIPDEATMQGLIQHLSQGADALESYLTSASEALTREWQYLHLMDEQGNPPTM